MSLSRDDHEAARQLSSMYEERKKDRGPELAVLEKVNLHYNGEYVVPLPELDEDERPAIANLIYIGVETHATRVASVVPAITYPSMHAGSRAADERARDRRLATLGWWRMNNMKVKDRRRARFLTAYGTAPVSLSPVSIDPNDKRRIPFWRVRNPLTTFPSPSLDPDSMEPTDCLFVDYKPLSWLVKNYPAQARVLSTGNDHDTDLFTVLEYNDEVETVYCVLGKERTKQKPWEKARAASMQEILGRVENPAGMCLTVNPGRISLTHVMGQFDQMFGAYQRAAKLDALNTIAVFRDVFPDQWAVSPANAATRPKIIQEADGKNGIIGEMENGTIIALRSSPGPATGLAMDQMERTERLMGILPEQIGGEGATNVRTARQGTQLLSSAIDMPIQEAQEILELSKELENVRAIAIMKNCYGSAKSTFVMGRSGRIDQIASGYVPNEVFETDMNEVRYPMPGTDINGLVISIGQRLGLGTMSIMTAMTLDPTIEDAEEEYARVQVDQIRKAILSGIEQRIAGGTMDPVAGARLITTMLDSRTPVEQALIAIDKVLAKEQADQQNSQTQQPPGQPAEATPEQQPGVEAHPGNPPQGPPKQSPPSLEDLLENLHVPQNLQGNAPSPKATVGVQ